MKNPIGLFSIAAAFAVFTITSVQAQTLASWTFETSADTNTIFIGTGASQSGFGADIGTGTGTASHALATTVWSMPVGHGSAHSLSANMWGIGDYFQFSTSTLGNSGIGISFEQISSGTGPANFTLQYSTDGTTFFNFANYNIVAGGNAGINTWSNNVAGAGEVASEYSFDLSSVSALNNQANVYFRLTDASTTAANGGTVALAGTDRVDDFTISLIAVPEPTTTALAVMGGIMSLVVLRRKR